MTYREVFDIPTMQQFNVLADSLNLSDRQREIFELRFSRKWAAIDIAMKLGYSLHTIQKECAAINKKLKCL